MTERDRRACRRDFIARGRLLARSQPAQTAGPAPEFVADSPLRVSDRLKDSPIDLTARESPGRSVTSCNGGASRWCPPWIGQVSIIPMFYPSAVKPSERTSPREVHLFGAIALRGCSQHKRVEPKPPEWPSGISLLDLGPLEFGCMDRLT